jgi:hypothetical protein
MVWPGQRVDEKICLCIGQLNCVKGDDIPILRIEISRLASRTVPGYALACRKLGSATLHHRGSADRRGRNKLPEVGTVIPNPYPRIYDIVKDSLVTEAGGNT